MTCYLTLPRPLHSPKPSLNTTSFSPPQHHLLSPLHIPSPDTSTCLQTKSLPSSMTSKPSSLWRGISNLLPDILPMINPGDVQIRRKEDLNEGTGGTQTEGMVRLGAIVGLSERICGSVMIAKPHTSSAVHHHGEQDTIIYAQSGHGTIISGPEGTKIQNLAPGDFALIPAWAEHQEVNESDEEVVWIITRSGGTPVVVNLKGWGAGQS